MWVVYTASSFLLFIHMCLWLEACKSNWWVSQTTSHRWHFRSERQLFVASGLAVIKGGSSLVLHFNRSFSLQITFVIRLPASVGGASLASAGTPALLLCCRSPSHLKQHAATQVSLSVICPPLHVVASGSRCSVFCSSWGFFFWGGEGGVWHVSSTWTQPCLFPSVPGATTCQHAHFMGSCSSISIVSSIMDQEML